MVVPVMAAWLISLNLGPGLQPGTAQSGAGSLAAQAGGGKGALNEPSRSLRPLPVPEGFSSVNNAALLYYQATFLLLSSKHELTAKNVEFTTPEGASADWTPTPAQIDALNARQEAVALLVRASQIERCDWGYEFGLGWALLLPQMGEMRGAARLLNTDIRRLVAQNAPSGEIAPRAAALVRMGPHTASQPTLIGSLVGAAIVSLGADTIEFVLRRGSLDAAGREEVLAAVRGVNNADPLGFREALRNEQRLGVASVKALTTDPSSPLARGLRTTMESDAGNAARVGEGLKDIERELRMLTRAYDDLLAAWDAPDAEVRLRDVGAKTEAGGYGNFARVLMPALDKMRQVSVKTRDRLAALQKALEDYQPPAPPADPAR